MPRCILKLGEDQYLEWSTVVDAPTTYICTREEMKNFLIKQDANKINIEVEERLLRADTNGTSFISGDSTVQSVISANRAGDNEKHLTLKQIKEKYTYKEGKEQNESVEKHS